VKYAVVENERREAQPGLSAKCPVCGRAMIAKCGEHRIRHWAHKGTRTCDPWWEPETEWHRSWKNHFPKDCQEIIRHSEDGEKHIADVMTESGMVIEFQHSNLRREEQEAREDFYQKMVWVVDGLRRVRDRAHFFASLGLSKIIYPETRTVLLLSRDISSNNALLRDWASSRVDVYFDFGDTSEIVHTWRFDVPILWRLTPRSPNGTAILTPVTKAFFLKRCLKGPPPRFLDFATVVERVLAEHAARTSSQRYGTPVFPRYMARRQQRRRHPRF
jgi:hypothetical protein